MPPPAAPGRLIGERYELLQELGRGGAATVFLARDRRLGTEVAVKILRPELGLAVGSERFLREIRLASRLTHPHIVPVLDSGETEGALYFVMARISGDSLRVRLERERQLPLAVAMRIGAEVADALAHAHAQGVIHRDIKPENILLAGGHAWIADFGMARGLDAAGGDRLTSSGITVGTPAYMSPEQAGGTRELDGRSDVYALGCVLFEMLAGVPPFVGPTPQSVMTQRMSRTPPLVGTYRDTAPATVQDIIARALRTTPADRPDAATLARALSAAVSSTGAVPAATPPAPRSRARVSWRTAAGATLAALALAATFWSSSRNRSASSGDVSMAAVDSTRFVVLPFDVEPALGVTLHADQRMRDALSRWHGIDPVDLFQVRDAIARRGGDSRSLETAGALARSLGAGRVVRGEITGVSRDSLRVYAAAYDVAHPERPARTAQLRIARAALEADGLFEALADSLLFRTGVLADRLGTVRGTDSRPARQAYLDGQAALAAWELTRADSAFGEATRLDPEYAQAHLWRAQVRAWRDDPEGDWGTSAQRALDGQSRLADRDRALATALHELSIASFDSACATYGALARRNPQDFSAWFGLGECRRRDHLVVRSAASPSKWRFHGSYHAALLAYQHAFRLLPSSNLAFKDATYDRLRALLFTDASSLRGGRAAAPMNAVFLAYPSWDERGDSLTFIPYPADSPPRPSPTYGKALLRDRAVFRQIAEAWAAAFPSSADAAEALSVALDMEGDPSALAAARRGRSLSRDDEQRTRLASSEAWLEIKFALPDALAKLAGGKRLADSLLLASATTAAGAGQLTAGRLRGLASLTGRANLAARIARASSERAPTPSFPLSTKLPASVVAQTDAYAVFAAIGGPADSIAAAERALSPAVSQNVEPSLRRSVLAFLVRQGAALAFPVVRLPSHAALDAAGDDLLAAQQALARGDSAAARRGLTTIRHQREGIPPQDVSIDAVYLEASLLAAVGDTSAAVAWLDPSLRAIAAYPPQQLERIWGTGPLIRAMVLRADLAALAGDSRSAARWGAAVAVLWADADPPFQQIVTRMRSLQPRSVADARTPSAAVVPSTRGAAHER